MVVPKTEPVETWSRYVLAPADAFQLNVTVVGCVVAPSGGERSVGMGGGAEIVAKPHAPDQSLIPPAFLALTRQ